MNIICLVISWKKLVLVQHIIHFIELFMPNSFQIRDSEGSTVQQTS